MKKTLTSLFLLITSLVTYSQFQESAKVLDIGFGYSDGDNQSRQIIVAPQLGFTLNSSQVFYAGVALESRKFDFSSFDETENVYSLTLGYEKFFELNPKIYFATYFNIAGGLGEREVESVEEIDITRFAVNFQPRLHYFINSQWSVVASIGAIQYLRENLDGEFDETTNDSFSANLNLTNVNFGIRLNLNNKAN